MSRELKLGFLTLVISVVSLWGYQYIKGKNILNKVRTYEAVYGNVEGLEVAAPVEVNGFPIGSIQKIDINKNDVKTMLVMFEVEGDYQFPKNTVAVLAANNSLVGSKKLILEFDALCNSGCLQSGDRMASDLRGVLQTILPTEELAGHLTLLQDVMGGLADSMVQAVSGENANNSIAGSLRQMELAMTNMASLTETLDRFMRSTQSDLKETIANMASISQTLEDSNADLKGIMSNVSDFTGQIADADIESTFDQTNDLMKNLQVTMDEATGSFGKLNEILDKVETGEGSISQLLNDDEMYDNLEATSKNLSLLLQDLRLNPKRYFRFSVFGRKGQQYTYPEDDPGFNADVLLKNDDIEKENMQTSTQ